MASIERCHAIVAKNRVYTPPGHQTTDGYNASQDGYHVSGGNIIPGEGYPSVVNSYGKVGFSAWIQVDQNTGDRDSPPSRSLVINSPAFKYTALPGQQISSRVASIDGYTIDGYNNHITAYLNIIGDKLPYAGYIKVNPNMVSSYGKGGQDSGALVRYYCMWGLDTTNTVRVWVVTGSPDIGGTYAGATMNPTSIRIIKEWTV